MYIMPLEPISRAYFINPFRQSVYLFIAARNQRKAGDYFSPEFVMKCYAIRGHPISRFGVTIIYLRIPVAPTWSIGHL
jgi:hypothetical protein